ncbi:MAG TPA: TonB-dependent receptor, partial [Bryobacteraceae bacterium]|nr:TonB-dependent receptor [Bryobacteraceae bacterium]
AALEGDFSTLESVACQSSHKVRPIYYPNTKTPIPGDKIPASMFDPAAVKLTTYLPTTGDPCGKVVYGIPGNSSEDQYIGRVDWVKNEKHALYGRYFLVDYSLPANWDAANILVTVNPGNVERAQGFTLGDTYTFNPATINAFHATFTRRRDDRGPNAQDISVKDLGVDMAVAVPNDMRISTSSSFNVGCGTCAPGFFNVNTFQFADDIDFIRGRHHMAFGVDFIRTQDNTLTGYLQNGNIAFNGQSTNDPILDFLTGQMSAFSQSRAQQVAMRENIPGLYAQDTFKVNPRLTINAGVRWEPMLFPQDYFGRGSSFNMSAFLADQKSSVFTNAPAGMFYYGDKSIPKAFTHDKWTNFAPRLGLVFDPGGNGKQTIRVGGAILYDSGMVWFAQRLMSNPPYVNEIDLTGPLPLSNPWTGYPGGNPFPGVVPPPSDVTFPTQAFYAVLPPNLKPTYMSQWNASYQREFAANWLVSASYLGNHTTHLWLTQDLNPSVYIPGICGKGPCSTTGNTAKRRLLYLQNPSQGQYLGQVALADDGGTSSYNGLLVSVQHRFSQNFTFLGNYTWSHCIGDGDFNGDLRGAYYQNPYNRSADRADCNFDIRHIFNASIVAISPFKGNGFAGRLLSNWKLAPLVRMTSGVPVNLLSGKDNSLTAQNLDRPNLVSTDVYPSSIGPSLQWFSPDAFAANQAGTFGNVGRDSLRAPGAINFDVALSRDFALTERFRLDARAEGFNVINHTNFNGPSATLTSSTFGRITSAGDPRILQFALKLIF